MADPGSARDDPLGGRRDIIVPQMQHTLYHSPALTSHPAFAQKQQRQKAFVAGITAGAEDVKYQGKYKELKKKVKEIEMDNDRLYFKLLLAKKNIRRMNLERAILYERLAAVPPTPGRQPTELPPVDDPLFHPAAPLPPEQALTIDPNDHALVEYMRTHPNARLVQAPDGRVIAVEDNPALLGHAEPPLPPQAPPHELPLVHSFRHDSGPGYDTARQLPPMMAAPPQPMPPMHDPHAPQYPAHPHPHADDHYPNLRGPPSYPPMHHHLEPRARPEREPSGEKAPRWKSSGADRKDREAAHLHHEREYARRPASPTSDSGHSPSTRGSSGSGRLHNHQRVGPGANINRDVDAERGRAEDEDGTRRREAPLVGPGAHGDAHRPASRDAYEYERGRESRGYDEAEAGPSLAEGRRRSRAEGDAGGEIRSPVEGGARTRPSPRPSAASRVRGDDGEGAAVERRDVPMDEDE